MIEINTRWARVEYGDVNDWVESTNLINVADPSVADDPNHRRQRIIHIWYLADVPADATRATYLEDLSGLMARQAQQLWEFSGAFGYNVRHRGIIMPFCTAKITNPARV